MPAQYLDTISVSRYFRDLRGLADDRTVLSNPHKGWYIHFIDNGINRKFYRDGIPDGDYLHDFPGLNHMYLRFDWGDIEKSEGVFDWSYIDDIIDRWGREGYRFSMRLCTYEGGSGPDGGNLKIYATPKWVFDRGAKYFKFKDACEPDYGDPVYLEYLERFMAEFGRKYNGNPLIEFLDVGTFGTWGEGHTTTGSCKTFSLETLLRHIDMHIRNFPDTRVVVNDDMINHRFPEKEEDTLFLLDYCDGKGLGIRDDSILVDWYAKTMGYDSMRSPYMFDRIWPHGPVDIERGHYRLPTDGQPPRNELVFAAALEHSHATYAGFHGYPRLWLENQYNLTEYLANRLGYWYFLDGVDLPEGVSGCPTFAEFVFRNKGFAPAYNHFTLKAALVSGTGEVTALPASETDNRRWMPGEVSKERVKLDLRGVKPGDYGFLFGLFEGERPIELGISRKVRTDGGMYLLDKLSVR